MLFSQQDREQYDLDGTVFYPPVWLLMDAILLCYTTILWGTDTERCVGSSIPLEIKIEASMDRLWKKSSSKNMGTLQDRDETLFYALLMGHTLETMTWLCLHSYSRYWYHVIYSLELISAEIPSGSRLVRNGTILMDKHLADYIWAFITKERFVEFSIIILGVSHPVINKASLKDKLSSY